VLSKHFSTFKSQFTKTNKPNIFHEHSS
jgi:hypothetical protein